MNYPAIWARRFLGVRILPILGIILLFALTPNVHAQQMPSISAATDFVYEGKLTRAGKPVNGEFDVMFQFFDSRRVPLGGDHSDGVTVVSGVLTVRVHSDLSEASLSSPISVAISIWPRGAPGMIGLLPRQPLDSASPWVSKGAGYSLSGTFRGVLGTGLGTGRGTGNGTGTGRPYGDPDIAIPAPAVAPLPPSTAPLKLLSKPRAVYTEIARQNNVQGVVKLRVQFLASGQIGLITVVEGLPDGLNGQATEAAKKIRFEPQRVRGVPKTTVKQIEYSFILY